MNHQPLFLLNLTDHPFFAQWSFFLGFSSEKCSFLQGACNFKQASVKFTLDKKDAVLNGPVSLHSNLKKRHNKNSHYMLIQPCALPFKVSLRSAICQQEQQAARDAEKWTQRCSLTNNQTFEGHLSHAKWSYAVTIQRTERTDEKSRWVFRSPDLMKWLCARS